MSSFTKKSAGTTRAALLTALLGVLAGSVALAPDADAALCERHKATLFGVKEDNSPGPCKDCVREREEAAERTRREQAERVRREQEERARREAEARRQRENPPPVPPVDGGYGGQHFQGTAPVAAEINHLFSGTIWAMPSNKTFAIAFYRDGLYYQENGSVNNFFRSVWKPGPPTTAFTDKATFIIDSRTIRNGVLLPGVSKMEKHSLDGVKDLWVFVRYTGKPPPVVCKECKKSPCVCARLPNDFGRPKTVMLPGGVKLEMVWLRPGTFMMGSPTSEKEREGNEVRHRVTISKPFYLGKYEVTQEQYVALMGDNPSCWKAPQLPVERVTWHDAVAFCERLTEQERKAGRLPTDYAYQLPTEAQWEYACRAGTTTPFAVPGTTSSTNYDTVMRRVGWFNGNSGIQPVGKKTDNPWGLYDMHGNVWEWCADWFAVDFYARSSAADPSGPDSGSYRVLRGGGWLSPASNCRSACRGRNAPFYRADHTGFRVACVSARP